MINAHIISVAPEKAGERIDKIICGALDSLSRSAVQKIIDEGGVSVGGVIISKNY
ncbi:MAG: RNA pseudouridine synthase, partial [Clostridia bacterium]|nr:RNA pseudouridine synthase [Clostridia bacterium]